MDDRSAWTPGELPDLPQPAAPTWGVPVPGAADPGPHPGLGGEPGSSYPGSSYPASSYPPPGAPSAYAPQAGTSSYPLPGESTPYAPSAGPSSFLGSSYPASSYPPPGESTPYAPSAGASSYLGSSYGASSYPPPGAPSPYAPAAGPSPYASAGPGTYGAPGRGGYPPLGPGQPYGTPPPHGAYAPLAPNTSTDGFAIAALVFGILGGWLSLVFGPLALSRIKRSGARGRGMAIAGIWLGSAWVIGGILLAIALPVFLNQRHMALHNACAGGDMAACDTLFNSTREGTPEHAFGDTCGGRTGGGYECTSLGEQSTT